MYHFKLYTDLQADVLDSAAVSDIVKRHPFRSVIHFAAVRFDRAHRINIEAHARDPTYAVQSCWRERH